MHGNSFAHLLSHKINRNDTSYMSLIYYFTFDFVITLLAKTVHREGNHYTITQNFAAPRLEYLIVKVKLILTSLMGFSTSIMKKHATIT